VTLRMLGKRVAVTRDTENKGKIGAIFVPDTAEKPTPWTGVVAFCGPDCKLLKVGDQVVYGKYCGGEEVELPDRYLMVDEDKVLAVLE
jgi:co-chaperonin GroES (HSP10)